MKKDVKGFNLVGLLGVLCGLFVFLQPGCGGSSGAEDDGRPLYVATVGMIGDLLREFVGDSARVLTLVGEGVDPHLYQPTRRDVVEMSRADAVFYLGLHLEGRMGNVLERLQEQGKPVFALGELLRTGSDYPLITQHGQPDPHLWMDPLAWKEVGLILARELALLQPEQAAAIGERAARWAEKVEALHQYALNSLQTIPPDRRMLITAHDAFAYLGRAYALEVRGIQGISTESEAGLRDIEALVNLIVERQIPAVFVETSVSSKNVQALVEGARARGHSLNIGGSLFSDAMGPGGTYTGTYIGMLDHNLTTLVRSLGGQAPADGWQGKLVAEASDN